MSENGELQNGNLYRHAYLQTPYVDHEDAARRIHQAIREQNIKWRCGASFDWRKHVWGQKLTFAALISCKHMYRYTYFDLYAQLVHINTMCFWVKSYRWIGEFAKYHLECCQKGCLFFFLEMFWMSPKGWLNIEQFWCLKTMIHNCESFHFQYPQKDRWLMMVLHKHNFSRKASRLYPLW